MFRVGRAQILRTPNHRMNKTRRFRRGMDLAHDDAKMRRVEGVTPRVSFADLQRMPDDGNRYELYDGELRVVPSPLPIHEIVKWRLLEQLLRYAATHGGEIFDAPFDIALSEYDVVQPDIVYFSPATAARIRLREHVRFAPQLAVEVLSPSTARFDRVRKRALLERYQVAEYWIVDPDAKQLEASILTGDRFASAVVIRSAQYPSPTLAGLAIEISPLFAGLD
jgi:Uma2 family endonuclease